MSRHRSKLSANPAASKHGKDGDAASRGPVGPPFQITVTMHRKASKRTSLWNSGCGGTSLADRAAARLLQNRQLFLRLFSFLFFLSAFVVAVVVEMLARSGKRTAAANDAVLWPCSSNGLSFIKFPLQSCCSLLRFSLYPAAACDASHLGKSSSLNVGCDTLSARHCASPPWSRDSHTA